MDYRPVEKIISESLENPIGMDRLGKELKGNEKVLILTDDYTRSYSYGQDSPYHGKRDYRDLVLIWMISPLLVASGTHRPMNDHEKLKKYGSWLSRILRWWIILPLMKIHCGISGETENGTRLIVNSLMLESDFVIGMVTLCRTVWLVSLVVQKIVQPGVCGVITTGQTHWLSAVNFEGKDIMGRIDNPVRDEIDKVGVKAGLKFIFNTVQSGSGEVYKCVCGEPVQTLRLGCKAALKRVLRLRY